MLSQGFLPSDHCIIVSNPNLKENNLIRYVFNFEHILLLKVEGHFDIWWKFEFKILILTIKGPENGPINSDRH